MQRSFQHLLSPADQEKCLRRIQRHLRIDGILVLNLFDPRYEFRLLAEYSDFEKLPPNCGKEQVWVAAKNH